MASSSIIFLCFVVLLYVYICVGSPKDIYRSKNGCVVCGRKWQKYRKFSTTASISTAELQKAFGNVSGKGDICSCCSREISRWRTTGKNCKVTYDDNRKVGREPKRVGSKKLVRPTQLINYGHESEVSELRYENGDAGSYENDSSQPESNQAKSRTLLDVTNWRKISTKFGHIFESPYGDRLLPKQVSDKMHQSISNLSKRPNLEVEVEAIRKALHQRINVEGEPPIFKTKLFRKFCKENGASSTFR
eukprot:gene2553-749_t